MTVAKFPDLVNNCSPYTTPLTMPPHTCKTYGLGTARNKKPY